MLAARSIFTLARTPRAQILRAHCSHVVDQSLY